MKLKQLKRLRQKANSARQALTVLIQAVEANNDVLTQAHIDEAFAIIQPLRDETNRAHLRKELARKNVNNQRQIDIIDEED